MHRLPPGLLAEHDRVPSSEPESATHSRERRRVALIVRELSTHLDAKFAELGAKIDMATAGLVAIANRELATLTPHSHRFEHVACLCDFDNAPCVCHGCREQDRLANAMHS